MVQLSEMTYFGILINSVLPITFISFIGGDIWIDQ